MSDPLSPDCDAAAGSLPPLDPNESLIYNCTLANVGAGFTNVASVTADDLSGRPVADTSPDAVVTVLVPSVDIQKGPDLQQVQTGGTVTFTITVTNTGPVDAVERRRRRPALERLRPRRRRAGRPRARRDGRRQHDIHLHVRAGDDRLHQHGVGVGDRRGR